LSFGLRTFHRAKASNALRHIKVETEMSYLEMTEIAGGARELTDAELAMVAGGSVWSV
jgi:hypothetical protein